MGDVPPFFPADLEERPFLNGSLTQNITDVDDVTRADEFPAEAQEDVVLAAFRILIFVIGILGNLLVIFVILILAEYKKAVTHWYVLQLAIADSLFLLTLPLRAAESLDNNWRNDVWSCKLKETVMFLNYYSSICFLVVMSIDRYVAVCHWRPTSILQKLRTPSAAIVITIGVWIVSFLLCTPVLLYSTSKGQKPSCTCQYVFPEYRNATQNCIDEGFDIGSGEEFEDCVRDQDHTAESYCVEKYILNVNLTEDDYKDLLFGNIFETTPSPLEYYGDDVIPVGSADQVILNQGCHYIGYAPGFIGFLWVNFIMMFVIPLLAMTACYTMIVFRLNATRSFGESRASQKSDSRPSSVSSNGRKKRKGSSSKSSRNKTRVTIMCACMVVLFVICWLPFHGVHLAKMQGIHSKSSDFCNRLSQIVSLIAFANSMLNPIIYNFVGTRFVRRIKRVRETRSFKALFHFTSGVTTAPARHSSASGTEHQSDKSTPKQRWRSEAALKKDNDQAALRSSAVYCKTGNGEEQSYIELMKNYPVYTGPAAQPPQQSENQSRNEPPPYLEPSTTITESEPLTINPVTATPEQ